MKPIFHELHREQADRKLEDLRKFGCPNCLNPDLKVKAQERFARHGFGGLKEQLKAYKSVKIKGR